MSKPKIAEKDPAKVELEVGKTYYWCQCGLSKNQPYCDGSHSETEFNPVEFTVEKTKTAYLCRCKQTSKPPYCDGTHKTL